MIKGHLQGQNLNFVVKKRKTWFVTDKSICGIILVIYGHPQVQNVNFKTKWPKICPLTPPSRPLAGLHHHFLRSCHFSKHWVFLQLYSVAFYASASPFITSPLPFNTSPSPSSTSSLSRHPLTHLWGLLTPLYWTWILFWRFLMPFFHLLTASHHHLMPLRHL